MIVAHRFFSSSRARLMLVLAGALVLAFVAGPSRAQPLPLDNLPAGIQAVTQVEGVGEYRLANGLQVLLVPDPSKPSTLVNLTYRVGSRHENYGETGMAHLLEHLIFKGTPTTPNAWAEFSRRGMRPNGTTSLDRTNYFASFAADPENLRWYLSWQADAMVNSFIAKKDLDSEMTVVRNEMERGENNPQRVLMQNTLSVMYRWHNYGKATIGARSDVENVDIPRLQAFYRMYYQPDNATLIVSGAFDPAQTLRWVSESFGALKKPERVLPTTYTIEAVQDGERSVQVKRAGGTPQVMLGYHAPPATHADFIPLSLAMSVLGSSPSGRLHAPLVQRGLATGVFGFTWALAEPGIAWAGAALGAQQDPDAARAGIVAVVDGLAQQPFTAEETERVKAQWLKDWELGFTDPERVGGALSEAVAVGDWRMYFLARDRVRAATAADLQRAAVTWLKPDNRTVAIYRPVTAPQRAPEPQKVDVAAAVAGYRGDPAAAQAEAFDPTPANLEARTQRFTVGGLKVGVVPKRTRGGVVQAVLRLHVGDTETLRGEASTALLLGTMLDKGGAGMTRQQVADRFDQLRAQVGMSMAGQILRVDIRTTRPNLDDTVALVARLLREPAFDADTFAQMQREQVAAVERRRGEPSDQAQLALLRHGNPYPRGDLRHARTFDEQVADHQAVTLERLRAFHRRFVSAATGEFAAVGDLDVASLRRVLESRLGEWRQPADGPRAYTRIPDPLVPVPGERILLRTPDKANAELRGRFALPVNDAHPDHPALMVADHLFGSNGVGRLWQRVRDKEGLSYAVGAWTATSRWESHSPWNVVAIFAPQNLGRVETAIRDELTRSLRDGFTEAEFKASVASLLARRKLTRAQDDAMANLLAADLHQDRRFDEQQRIDTALASLTLDRVNAAWRRHMTPERVVFAVGGDFKQQP